MINLSSSDEDILREVSRYYQKAVYWLHRHMDSREMREEVNYRVNVNRGHAVSVMFPGIPKLDDPIDPVFYRPKGATPWVCSAIIRLSKGVPYIYPICVAFYETVGGGCGFFLPSFYNWTGIDNDVNNEVRHCTIVTSHCSLRWRERTGNSNLQGTDLAIRLAHSIVAGKNFMHTISNTKGRHTVIVKNDDGYFFGLYRLRDENNFRTVIELRTFLTHDMLSLKQRFMLGNIQDMDNTHVTDPFHLTDEQLYRYWYYNGCTDQDELIGRILLLRSICVLTQRVEKKMSRYMKTHHIKVDKYNGIFKHREDMVRQLGSTGMLCDDLRELILLESGRICVKEFGVKEDDTNYFDLIVSITEQALDDIGKLDYFSLRRNQLLDDIPKWKQHHDFVMKRTSAFLNAKHS